jgi:hypothetical protein
MGFIGYYTFREDIEFFIIWNIDPLTVYSSILITLFFFNTLTTYPLQILCIFDIIEENKFFKSQSDSSFKKSLKVTLSRIFIIISITAISSAIPNFMLFQNLVGSIAGCLLAFIIPPIFYMKVYWNTLSKPTIAFNIGLIIVGGMAGLESSY